MKKTLITRFLALLLFLFIVFLFFAILGFGFIQTSWVKNSLTKKLVEEAEKRDLTLTLEGLSGVPPLKWSLDKASILFKDGSFVEIENARIRVSLLSLFKKKISIRFMAFDSVHYAFLPSLEKETLSLDFFPKELPFDISARTIRCKKVSLENLFSHETLTLNVEASAKIDRNLKEISFDVLLQEPSSSNTLKVTVLSSEKKDILNGSLDLNLQSSQQIALFFNLPCAPSLDFSASLFGKQNYLKNKNPFSFSVNGHLEALNLPGAPYFNHPSTLQIEASLLPESSKRFSLSCKECILVNDWLDLKGYFHLSPDLKPLSGMIACHLTNIESFNTSIPLKGSIESVITLDPDSFFASVSSKELTIGKETYVPVSFELSARKENDVWNGTSNAKFTHPSISWEESCRFLLDSNALQVFDLSLCCSETKLGGSGSFHFNDNSYLGSFFVMAGELRPFRSLFPSSDIDGKLGGTLSLQGKAKDLSFQTTLLLKNIRYQNSLIHVARIEANLENILSSPSGFFSCDLENIFFRDMLLSKVQITSEPSSLGKQTFSTKIQGEWRDEVRIEADGFFEKQGPFWEVNLKTCQGDFLNSPFSLEGPFKLGRNENAFFIEHCSWKIGEGSLSGELLLEKEQVFMKSDGNHIPLGLLGVAYPKIAFQGLSSFQSMLSGSAKDLKGHLFATLEQADFLENKAKGSLQIHMNSLGAQIHAHLYASKNQFLDCTATLPLNYSYAPFSWTLDQNRSFASEITMQGAIEDIFDFINATSHKASGWVTAHLFLSKNKKEPSVQGTIECQQGSYKNFSSGTILNNIEAEITASNNAFHIVKLQATDEKEGSLKGTGDLLLIPSKKYPFNINAEIENMHVVHFDFIDTSLTGTLEIKGDQTSSTISGNLNVEKADIKISDDLPCEIPALPITYINKPISLQTSSLQSTVPYPLYIEAELTADQRVFVTGKGLNSEWHGAVHLTGLATNLSATGSLALTKGEFLFSGKTFTLMQGEISFSDKPGASSYLKINGELQLPSAIILAQMQGPLTSPSLTFQSIPVLPTSSILSLILFNKDISEISALQALQLAHMIVSLSGNGGPDILESIRKSIGIDRLNIVGKDGTDEISLQIGWYLNHGITLSLSQSATSSDVTVEVDLKNGFIFQAETQNQEEGKFSLKWNKNY